MAPTSGPIVPSRKRAVLIVIAVLQIAYSVSINLPPYRPTFADGNRSFVWEALPFEFRGPIWILLGVLAIASAPSRFHRIGWIVLVIMPMTRLIGNGLSALAFIIPGGNPGVVTAIPNTVFWMAWAALVWAIAGWPDLSKHVRQMGRGQTRADLREIDEEELRNKVREVLREEDLLREEEVNGGSE